MRSRWSLVVVVLELAAIGAVVACTTRPSATSTGRTINTALGRAAIQRFFADVRSAVLPTFDGDALPVPWDLPFRSDEHRRAWESHLATITPRLHALDDLHEDPDVQGLLLIGDGKPVLEGPVKMYEMSHLTLELCASAQLALDRGDLDAAMRRVEQVFEVVLAHRDPGKQGHFYSSVHSTRAVLRTETLTNHPRWDARRAYSGLAPRLRALVDDQVAYLHGWTSIGRRVEYSKRALQDGYTVSSALDGAEREESRVEHTIAMERTLLLAFAADAFRAEHGRWPANTHELAPLVSAAELRTPLVPEPMDLAPEGPNLRVGLIHSKRPANELGTTRLLVR